MKLARSVQLFDDKIILSDNFEFAGKKPRIIYERFVSLIQPEKTADGIKIRSLTIKADGKIRRETINAHDGNPLDVYLIDVEEGEDFSVAFEF